ncbi:MAG TPA: hypothetical protein VMI53_04405 [Opitutaceae bacterium]|nr:hypothetical protein [Opitutaceae bacterium]
MKTLFLALIVAVAATRVSAVLPVFDAANIAQQQVAHAEEIAKWVESIAQLKTQIDQLNQAISLQSDIRRWAGDPKAAAENVALDALGAQDLVRSFGQTRNAIISLTDSLASLGNTGQGTYRPITDPGLDGQPVQFDPLIFRRFSVLDAQEQNYQQVVDDTTAREQDLQADLAQTLVELKNAPTDAEVRKQSAKINAINGQLASLSATRRDQADQVVAQKIANDARSDEERLAAAELAAKDDFLANQRVTAFMHTLKFRQNPAP